MSESKQKALDWAAGERMARSAGLLHPGEHFSQVHWDFIVQVADECASIGDNYVDAGADTSCGDEIRAHFGIA